MGIVQLGFCYVTQTGKSIELCAQLCIVLLYSVQSVNVYSVQCAVCGLGWAVCSIWWRSDVRKCVVCDIEYAA